jgi:hypothetical protein
MCAWHGGMQLGSMAMSLGPDMNGFHSERNGFEFLEHAPRFM